MIGLSVLLVIFHKSFLKNCKDRNRSDCSHTIETPIKVNNDSSSSVSMGVSPSDVLFGNEGLLQSYPKPTNEPSSERIAILAEEILTEEEFSEAYDRTSELIIGWQGLLYSDDYAGKNDDPTKLEVDLLYEEVNLIDSAEELQGFVYERLAKFLLKGN